MPVFPDPPFADGDILEVSNVNYSSGQLGLMVWHMRVGGVAGPDPQSLDTAAAKLELVFAPLVKAMLSVNASHRGTRIRRVFPDETSFVVAIGEQGDGDVAGDMMSKQTSGIITWQTGFPGRSNRGRKYFPFPAENDSNLEGKPSIDYLANMNTFGNVMLSPTSIIVGGATVLEMRLIIYRRAAPALSPLVTAYRVNPKWATQRRRGDYGKPNALPF